MDAQNTTPKVSIIMPVFNGSLYLKQAIESVLNQTYKNWELIVINDGSTDNSKEVIKNVEDNRLRYFEQSNSGVSTARNVGLKHMQGDYFCFLDADDALTENSIENRLMIFANNHNISFVDGVVHCYDKDLSKKVSSWYPDYNGNPLNELLKLSGACFFGPSWMIKRESGRKYKLKDGLTHGEDLLFYIEISREKNRIYTYTDRPVLKYRTGNNSAMINLKGLERGYHSIYKEIIKMPEIKISQSCQFRAKSKRIMFMSYLGKRQYLNALKVVCK